MDFVQAKSLVLDSVTAENTKRAYSKAIDDFETWFSAQTGGFTRATVQSYKQTLIAQGLSPATINLRICAIRRLTAEAADSGVVDENTASGISRVEGVKKHGVRLGNWLAAGQAERLIGTPDTTTLIGKRDSALLGVLIGCGLRREEASIFTIEHIQIRDGRWIIVDIEGKGNRVRSVPMPNWTKALIDAWLSAAGLVTGCVFRSIRTVGTMSHVGKSLAPETIYYTVRSYAKMNGFTTVAAHDLRRTFAKLAHKGKAPVEQIQLSLGHASIQTTEAYLGINQNLVDAPCDHLGLFGLR